MELADELPTAPARRHDTPIPTHRDHSEHAIFARGHHRSGSGMFGAEPHRTGRIDADSRINGSAVGDEGRTDTARLRVSGEFAWINDSPSFLIELLKSQDHSVSPTISKTEDASGRWDQEARGSRRAYDIIPRCTPVPFDTESRQSRHLFYKQVIRCGAPYWRDLGNGGRRDISR